MNEQHIRIEDALGANRLWEEFERVIRISTPHLRPGQESIVVNYGRDDVLVDDDYLLAPLEVAWIKEPLDLRLLLCGTGAK